MSPEARNGPKFSIPRELPEFARRLCEAVAAPPRLMAHLRIVHDVAIEIVAGLHDRFTSLAVDGELVLSGAAIHDFGKVLHPEELTGPGTLHEMAGQKLLIEHGISSEIARFAETHAIRNPPEDYPLEDLLCALADKIWKGKRDESLESAVVEKIAASTRLEAWDVFQKLDELLTAIASDADFRLEWQRANG